MTPDDEVPPQQLGNYTLLRKIGRGGFATVYLARHIHLNNYVAVKILHVPFGTIDRIDQFRKEAQTIAELAHPNIVRVLDFDVADDEFAFFVMDYAPFGSLRRQYKLGTLVPLPAVVSYVNQIASALHYAHQHRIIHRDVKPENMLVGKDKRVLLSDFGIAALMAGSRVQTGEAAGTINYIAPEQIRGKARPASDQYALAVSVYEWLTGESPFTGTMTEVVAKHLSVPPPSPRTYTPDMSHDVERVLLKALAKDPTQRFDNIESFARALSKAAGVQARAPEDERFISAVKGAGQSPNSTIALPSAVRSRSSNRDLASVRTIIHQEGQPSRASQRPVQQRKLISRRTILFGVVGVVGAGSIAATMAAIRQAPAAPVHSQSPVVTQPTSQANAPTTTPGAIPTKGLTPTPDPASTATTAPTQPVSQQPPTQPPAPTPTPTPLVPTGTLYTVYRGHSNVVFAVAWSQDGTRIASGGGDRTAQVWSAPTGTHIATYSGHTAAVTSVAWSPDSARIASASDDKTVHVWDATNGNLVFTCNGHTASVHSVAWSPDGTRIASASTDRTVRVWDSSGNLLLRYTNHTATVWGVAWSFDGMLIASASSDKTVRVWDLTGRTITTYSAPDITGNIGWSSDGKWIASASNNGEMDVWNATNGQLISSYLHTQVAYGVSWAPDRSSVASGSADKTVAVIDPAQGAARYIYRGHTSYVFGVAWSPDGTRIASGSDDRTVQVWF
jgi:WD40 repeat protein